MSLLIWLGVILGPIVLAAVLAGLPKWRWLFRLLAALAGMGGGGIAAVAVYAIRRDGTVMMTNIHRIFLNDWFLVCMAYVGVYGLASILAWTWGEYRESGRQT